MSTISRFMETHFRHFNARETLDAAKAWNDLLDNGGKMFLTMAGAMSTCELGISLAEMIRQDKVHAISCTAANLEEDLFNLFNHNEYKMVPEYRDLSPEAEKKLYNAGYNRVTDTCIPEGVLRQVQRRISKLWAAAAASGQPKFPYEFMYELLDQPGIEEHFQNPREHSWVLAAKQKGLPIVTPGFEDSTLGNIYCAEVMNFATVFGKIRSHFFADKCVRQVGDGQCAFNAVVVRDGHKPHALAPGFLIDAQGFGEALRTVEFLQHPLGRTGGVLGVYVQVDFHDLSFGEKTGARSGVD